MRNSWLYFAVRSLRHMLPVPLEGSKKTGHLHKVGSKASVLGLEIDQHVLGRPEGDTVEISQPYPPSHPDARVGPAKL